MLSDERFITHFFHITLLLWISDSAKELYCRLKCFSPLSLPAIVVYEQVRTHLHMEPSACLPTGRQATVVLPLSLVISHHTLNEQTDRCNPD